MASRVPQRVSIAGLGAIGGDVARRLAAGVPGVELVAVAGRDRVATRRTVDAAGLAVPVLDVDELAAVSDVVVECAPRAAFASIAEPVLRAGKELVALSAGALLDHEELVDLARRTGGTITIPAGALAGLDAVAAAAIEGIDTLTLVTRKPPAGLTGAPHLERTGVRLADLDGPVRVFSGTAREAARGFPASLNVAVALAFAGPGPDRTRVEVWADPSLTRNTHVIELRSSVTDITLHIANRPSANPRTGRITALSVVSLLAKRGAVLRIGS